MFALGVLFLVIIIFIFIKAIIENTVEETAKYIVKHYDLKKKKED